ncbi:MAG TPA: tRNA 2-thiouridine(34) synthase MnmA [bacterium]|nr:tRNA 2-thiouridine(34) synthase MnmA [bacterium]HPN29616.1 tRNA 2-thiouridine(34) synthase MnmA [bacterium]
MKTVVIGLSGGVDSSVAAALLIEKGYNVIGTTMKIWNEKYSPVNFKDACFSGNEKEDLEIIKQTVDLLKIPFHMIDLAGEYNDYIINYFKSEYHNGRTPNPCVVCNKNIKFNALLNNLKKTGVSFDYFATGHYAKIEFDETSSRYKLKKALDLTKDQSYFLSMLSQEQLSKIIFPLSDLTKKKVREIAENLKLPSSKKKESQDFYSGEYTDLLEKKNVSKGLIKTEWGETLGEHKGIIYYTIGQRRGLGISYNEPLYVTRIDKCANIIYVGKEGDLFKDELYANNLNWISIPYLESAMRIKCRIRYLHKEADAIIKPYESGKIMVKFDTPQKSITPGQFAVFYDGDFALGAGVIL